jgi:hypothetical protein
MCSKGQVIGLSQDKKGFMNNIEIFPYTDRSRMA